MILTWIHWGNSSFEGTIFKSDYDMKNEKEKKSIFATSENLPIFSHSDVTQEGTWIYLSLI